MEYTNVERIIAKIDNDFNPNNSDWIPRVGAWVHDVLLQLQIAPTDTVEHMLKVTNHIARSGCPMPNDIKVYDSKGCEIKQYNANKKCCNQNRCHPSTGDINKTPKTITAGCTGFEDSKRIEAITIPSITYPFSTEVIEYQGCCKKDITYTRADAKTIELDNYGGDFITVVYKAPKTEHSNLFKCELPVVPNNGKLIEAITYYCMYKMLCRGYKHPVFNLGASQYGTNPYHIWITTKDEAARSVINDGVDEDLSKLWKSAFFISTFGK